MGASTRCDLAELIADRFVCTPDGRALDLATGEIVHLDIARERLDGGCADTVGSTPGWPIVDEGWVNAHSRFAARMGVSSAVASYALFDGASDLDAAIELLDEVREYRVGGCTLVLRSREGARAALLRVARASRLRGIVPMSATLLWQGHDVLEILGGRSVACLVPPGFRATDTGRVNSAALAAAASGVRVVALISAGPVRVGPAIVVRDAPLELPAVRRKPARSGLPTILGASTGPGLLHVAEHGAALEGMTDAPVAPAARVVKAPDREPGSGDALERSCRARLGRSARFLAAGRPAAACRELRAVVGITEGRAAVAPQRIRGALALAGLRLDAGAASDALQLATKASEAAAAVEDVDALLLAAALRGHALIDLARREDAARLLVAARAARAGERTTAYWQASLALARCWFWQRDDERARQVIEEARRAEDGAVRGGAIGRAIRIAARDGRSREAIGLARELACLEAGTARVHAEFLLSLAHADVVARDCLALRARVREGLRACRAARLPMVALKLRLVWLAGARSFGERSEVRRLEAMLGGQRAQRLPPLLCARVEQALGKRARRPSGGGRLGRGVGLPLPLGSPREDRVVMDELLEVLTICHEAEDDGPALTRMCDLLRTRLDASAVSVVREGTLGRLAFAGQARAPSPDVADRAIATGRVVPAAPAANGLEAAAPIRYGGETIAAVSCRWPVDSTVDTGRASVLLSTAAAACAPSVRSILDRERAPATPDGEGLGLIGVSPAIERLRADVRRAAAVPFHVLIEGESGSGKELVARAIHGVGPRRARRFCAVNCAALTDDLLEAELFGHTRGAFTGAVAERVGLFEDAEGGTLFLDEVSELSPRAQAKLLRVIQEGEVRRLGENLPRRVDVRIVAATNRPLAGEVAASRFRADLRYRLEVVRIVVPALRDRIGDVAVLARRFWGEVALRAGSRARLDATTIEALARYPWPGNVRELQNAIAALAVAAPRVGRVMPAHLRLPASETATGQFVDCAGTLDEARRKFETAFVGEALRRSGGRRGLAARALGVSRQGLAKLIVRLGLDNEHSATGAAPG